MTNVSELRMNVAALKRVDPYVKDILETATHVALYTFNAETSEWEKTDVEGALFVYSRSGEPYNSFLIMNRLNTKNQVEPVTRGLDLQLHEPFLLYRNSKCDIHGIWFYEKDECVRIAAMLNKLVKDSENTGKALPKVKAVQRNPNNVDIFSMLSKAQEDFNINRGGNGESGVGSRSPMSSVNNDIPGPLSAPLGPDVTSQSVMDFFAKAKVNPMHFKAGDQPTPVHESKPLLARLMSHPAAHTLEHIEKQQRSTTPQPGPPSHHHMTTTPMTITANDIGNLSVSNRSKKKNKMISQLDPILPAPNVVQDLPQSISQNESNDSSFLRIQSPVNTTLLNNHHTNHILGSAGANSLASLFGQTAASGVTEDVISSPMTPRQPTGSGTSSAPALIPPVMFAAPSPAEPVNRPLEPLTRNQLLQAFNYLLRSDPDFVNKLHEAYVKSFSEILS
ncbi:mRNA-decapping enzyme 1A [Belonocnema kinseyi]|uniref:mRNA-decapping enzyme 1A n=1 Tax=Belonocnema kinseyi TaxID=2817044 RepID=UPI00143D49A5|nr:mRNA-decapping enzyme 1A [Belonocnema kinseyi]